MQTVQSGLRRTSKENRFDSKMSDRKTCEECEEVLEKKMFRTRSKVCKTCEEDPSHDKVCSTCNETYPQKQMNGNVCTFCRKGNWKTCTSCQKHMTTLHFRRGQTICKECENSGSIGKKKCTVCDIIKPTSDFRRNRGDCVDCERRSGRNYRRTTTKAKEWAAENKERMTELSKGWYQDNKEYIREKERTRFAEDPIFKNIKLYRIRLGELMRDEITWNDKLRTDLGDYREWLSDRFSEDMNLENYGAVWQVDHVLPLDLFYKKSEYEWCWSLLEGEKATPEELLFSWYNTQPLTKEQNRNKGNTVTLASTINHLTNLKKFMKDNGRAKTRTYNAYIRVLQAVVDVFYK